MIHYDIYKNIFIAGICIVSKKKKLLFGEIIQINNGKMHCRNMMSLRQTGSKYNMFYMAVVNFNDTHIRKADFLFSASLSLYILIL